MTELTRLKGIGTKSAEALSRLGISCAEDLLWYYPRDYEVFEKPVSIYALEPGKTGTVEGILFSPPEILRRGGITIVRADIKDMTGRLNLSWFNAPYMRSTLKVGVKYIFRGRIYKKNGFLSMSQPKVYEADTYNKKYLGKMMPIYPLAKGITNKLVVKAVSEALNISLSQAEFLPDDLKEKYGLIPAETALIRLHFPRTPKELSSARERVVFNEFFMNLLAGERLQIRMRERESHYRCKPDVRMIEFISSLPFELTKAQLKAFKDITQDMNSLYPMNRLLEGDVGSGKTIVAILAMVYASLNGCQSAIMAPTFVLASQHYQTLKYFLKSDALPDLKISFLAGKMSAGERKKALKEIESGEANIIVGTHALFQEDVEFSQLGLIVTDEQHRFGVAQREALAGKGEYPHTLIMSATPIPRTLSMILYQDMDVSVIDAGPKGRIAIKNCVVGPSYREAAYKFIYGQISKKRQAYVICPAIEEAAEDPFFDPDMENVSDYTKKLKNIFPEDVSIVSLNGRMKDEEKDRIMTAFKDGDIDILVSTTVIEVGVDVPNASVMMVENADRFGLAQLHQLRGRVGRGAFQSYCIMVNTSNSDKARERLEILKSSNDGFFIAEEDLRLRGPGDIFGTRQSGDLEFKLADIYRDADVLKKARSAADEILKSDPELEKPDHQTLRRKLSVYLEKGYVL